jgi:hypothetical protein
MFWSTSKEQKPSTSPDAGSDSSGVRERSDIVSSETVSSDEEESRTDVAKAPRPKRGLPRRQRPTPPESPSSKRGGELESEPPASDTP